MGLSNTIANLVQHTNSWIKHHPSETVGIAICSITAPLATLITGKTYSAAGVTVATLGTYALLQAMLAAEVSTTLARTVAAAASAMVGAVAPVPSTSRAAVGDGEVSSGDDDVGTRVNYIELRDMDLQIPQGEKEMMIL